MDQVLQSIRTWMGKKKGLKIAALVTAVVVLFGFIGISRINSIRSKGIAFETQLNAQYLDNQNYLSTFISGFYEQVSIMQAQGDQLNAILFDVVRGRYDKGGFSLNSAFFAAVVEAYPEASLQELQRNWGKIQDYIQSQRAGYRNVQSKLLDQLRAFDRWRREGIFQHFIKDAMFPSNDLVARVGDKRYRGKDGLEKMYQIVLVGEAVDAYDSGELDPLTVPPSKKDR